MFSRVGELYPMIVCSFGYISSSIEKYVLWVVHLFMYEIKFEEFIFANNLFGLSEASRRGVQKTVLERKGPSTFSCGVEIISKTELRIHRSLEATVDAILSGKLPLWQNKWLRWIDI